MSDLKQILYKELQIKAKAEIEGVNVNPLIFKNLALGTEYMEQIHGLFEGDHHPHVGILFPCRFQTPHGLTVSFVWDRNSRVSIEYKDGVFVLTENGTDLFPIEFAKRPNYYGKQTSDGVEMSHIANFESGKTVRVAYSNECALKEKGLDCLFCNANATKDTYAEKENIQWKTAKQIAETYAEAIKADGAKHFQLTGGFIPERREVDYYIDVAEAIQDATGLEDFKGNAVIGAPQDLSVIEKYKEAGFTSLAINLEVWDANFFKTICPGKEKECGGQKHWIEALEYAAKVFGKGFAGSNFVAGIEPKERTLEGVEILAEKGVAALVNPWNVNPGSALEGHRTPSVEWHIDMAQKAYHIYKKAGITLEHLIQVAPTDAMLLHDVYRIEEGIEF